MTTNRSNHYRDHCLICSSSNITEILNLGIHPFADTFIPKENLYQYDKAYPLICDLCLDCGQVQLKAITSPEERYCDVDYSYTSSNSNFSRTHWMAYADEVNAKVQLPPQSFVVEAGSNDGFLTEQFAKKGHQTLGVDPSPYMGALAQARGITTLSELFTSATAKKILTNHKAANLVIANNVFNHSEDPVDFAKAVASILAPNGTFVFELPYWAISVESKKFDQIYHEHVSYFTARSSAKVMEQAGMHISAIEVVNYHGGSLRVYAKKMADQPKHCLELLELVEKEEQQGLFAKKTYEVFMQDLLKQRSNFLKKVYSIKQQNIPIIAVGAAAKGNTFLNFYNLDSKTIDYVTDSSPHKQGKHTPLTRIPIQGDEIFKNYEKAYALILSWNIADQLKKILLPLNPNIEFISPEQES